MCSYNRINGTFACGNDSTLTKILRDEIGFKGFVTSDWGAVHAVNFINAGLDMEMPGEPKPGSAASRFLLSSICSPCRRLLRRTRWRWGDGDVRRAHSRRAGSGAGRLRRLRHEAGPQKMAEALKDGTVNEAAITRAAGRVLYEIVHFGYLDGQSEARASPSRPSRPTPRSSRRPAKKPRCC
jgi:beta-glucosidase